MAKKKAVKKHTEKEYLLFIDTNIFLDFYRLQTSDIQHQFLEKIANNADSIITSRQVQMEFLKNRQKVLSDTIKEINGFKVNSPNFPVIVSEEESSKAIKEHCKAITKEKSKLVTKINSILKEPEKHDEIFQLLDIFFKKESTSNLSIGKNVGVDIYGLAKDRFTYGYPPRKKDDTSVGDAINWEWIIRCAQLQKKHVIIVTRDGDFGISTSKSSVVNDFLRQEFQERVGHGCTISMTQKMSGALKKLEIDVSKEMEKEEEFIIKLKDLNNYQAMTGITNTSFYKAMMKLNKDIQPWISATEKINEIVKNTVPVEFLKNVNSSNTYFQSHDFPNLPEGLINGDNGFQDKEE